MTIEAQLEPMMRFPFLFQFALPLSQPPTYPIRYDAVRQISQVQVDGKWIDTVDASIDLGPSTKITFVQSETQDDA